MILAANFEFSVLFASWWPLISEILQLYILSCWLDDLFSTVLVHYSILLRVTSSDKDSNLSEHVKSFHFHASAMPFCFIGRQKFKICKPTLPQILQYQTIGIYTRVFGSFGEERRDRSFLIFPMFGCRTSRDRSAPKRNILLRCGTSPRIERMDSFLSTPLLIYFRCGRARKQLWRCDSVVHLGAQ